MKNLCDDSFKLIKDTWKYINAILNNRSFFGLLIIIGISIGILTIIGIIVYSIINWKITLILIGLIGIYFYFLMKTK